MQRIKIQIHTALLLLLLIIGNNLFAQSVVVTAKMDTTQILLGDQPSLYINVSAPKNFKIIWPKFNDTIADKVELIKAFKIDTTISNADNKINYIQKLTITSYDSGYHAISFAIQYIGDKDSTLNIVQSNPLFLFVNTIPADSTQAIKPIKNILQIPLTIHEIAEYLYYFISVALLVAIVVLIFNFIKQLKKHSLKEFFEVKKPAHEIALEELKKLKTKKLWQNNEFKLYYSELTDIIKNYVAKRFDISAPEMTTEELIPEIKKIEISNDLKNNITDLLKIADLVKFAKVQPTAIENEEAFSKSENIVLQTIPTITNEEIHKL